MTNLCVRVAPAVLLDKLKGLEEELDGTAERRRIAAAMDAAKAKVFVTIPSSGQASAFPAPPLAKICFFIRDFV